VTSKSPERFGSRDFPAIGAPEFEPAYIAAANHAFVMDYLATDHLGHHREIQKAHFGVTFCRL
jgi:hypothetical protein